MTISTITPINTSYTLLLHILTTRMNDYDKLLHTVN